MQTSIIIDAASLAIALSPNMQAMSMLSDEMELVSSLTSTLASFKEDPGVAAAGRQKSSVAMAARADHHTPHSRDPDVWPPPTPLEPRFVLHKWGWG